MADFADRVRSGAWTGHTGKRIRNVVNIGIGGSDLGPHMAYEALLPYADPDLTVRFVSNVDGTDFYEAHRGPRPGRDALHHRLEDLHHPRDDDQRPLGARVVARRASATTPRWPSTSWPSPPTATRSSKFGIDTDNMFGFWDWVGGRYSLRLGHRPVADDRHRPRPLRRDARRLPPDGRALPHRPDRAEPAGAARADRRLVRQLLRRRDARRAALQPVPRRTSRRTSSSSTWRATASRSTAWGQPVGIADRPDRVGPARHQRPARLLPADPPGHRS